MSTRPFLVIIGLLLPAIPTIAAEAAGTPPQIRITAPADVQVNFLALQQSCGLWRKNLPVNTASPASPIVSSTYVDELLEMCAVSQDPVSAMWKYGEFGAACAIVGLIIIAVFLRFLRIMVFGSKPVSWPLFGRIGRQNPSQTLRS